ncbi:MAG: hypothetical protein IKM99_02960 [Bacteroidales bacterium]|nr:hypothetical protein [Bacteroidales bacterium]
MEGCTFNIVGGNIAVSLIFYLTQPLVGSTHFDNQLAVNIVPISGYLSDRV